AAFAPRPARLLLLRAASALSSVRLRLLCAPPPVAFAPRPVRLVLWHAASARVPEPPRPPCAAAPSPSFAPAGRGRTCAASPGTRAPCRRVSRLFPSIAPVRPRAADRSSCADRVRENAATQAIAGREFC